MKYTLDQFIAVLYYIDDSDLSNNDKKFLTEQYKGLCKRDQDIARTEAMNIACGSPVYKLLHTVNCAISLTDDKPSQEAILDAWDKLAIS